MPVATPHRGRTKQYTVRQNPRMLTEAAAKEETVFCTYLFRVKKYFRDKIQGC